MPGFAAVGQSKERAFEQKEKVHKHFPLLRYATALCERLTAAGADVSLKQHSETMLRSRAINGRYQLLLVSENMLDATALPDADILLLSAEEMEDPSCEN